MSENSEERRCPRCNYFGPVKELDNKELIKGVDFSKAPNPEFARFYMLTGIFYKCPNCLGKFIDLADALAICGAYANIKESKK